MLQLRQSVATSSSILRVFHGAFAGDFLRTKLARCAVTGLILTSIILVPSYVAAESPTTTIIGVKLLKSIPGVIAQPLQIQLPQDCSTCSLLHGAFYEGQNAREVFFYVKVPVSQAKVANIKVRVGDLQVRAVVVEKAYLKFNRNGSELTFDVPIVPRERSSTLELQTSLEWPGITVRIEHAFEDRRAGSYATGPWPAVERQAALNLEFGLREAIRALKLDQETCERGLGTIHLMGFDTNFPLGHEDSPPHIHMILRWPHFAGSQAPHFYLSGAGLLQGKVKVTIDGMPQIAETFFAPGEPVTAIDYLGETFYETILNADGTLTLQRPSAEKCTLRPVANGDQGFASGLELVCSNGVKSKVAATDDTEVGVVRVAVDAKPVEIYRYDPDTAVLLSSAPTFESASCTRGVQELKKRN